MYFFLLNTGDAYFAMLDLKTAIWHYRKVLELDINDKEMINLIANLIGIKLFEFYILKFQYPIYTERFTRT